ncbi:MAG: hypothetical protein ACE5JO_02780 [Candidatus Binatia bacterium]
MMQGADSIRLSLVYTVLSILLLLPSSSEAVPAFARKYRMECTVCHTRPPRLNTFGERFLENGYQIPGTQDGGIVEKIKLGNVTLDLVHNYFAVRPRGNVYRQFEFETKNDAKDTQEFTFPEIVNVFFAGTLTRNVGTFIEMEGNIEKGEVEFERSFLTLNNLFSDWIGHDVAHLRFGKLDPSAYFSFPTHRQQLLPVPAKVEGGTLVRPALVPNAGVTKFFGLSNNEGKSILALKPILIQYSRRPGSRSAWPSLWRYLSVPGRCPQRGGRGVRRLEQTEGFLRDGPVGLGAFQFLL